MPVLNLINPDMDSKCDSSGIALSSRSDQLLSTVRLWHEGCLAHESCHNHQQKIKGDVFPSRLVDVHGGQVRLVTQTAKLLEINYTTLSHRWGDPCKMLKLSSDNLIDLQDIIPIEILPWSYRDAIKVTLALGYSYIWIDSLCIIQDSPEDWEYESTKMAGIYGGAICNISYIGCPSNSSDEPTFSLRDPRLFLPCVLKKAMDPGVYSLIAYPSIERREEGGIISGFEGPLSDRAWVFQERLLCPRTIYYGGPQLIWECCEGFQTELIDPSMLEDSLKEHFAKGLNVQDIERGSDGSLSYFGKVWWTLVSKYQNKKLT